MATLSKKLGRHLFEHQVTCWSGYIHFTRVYRVDVATLFKKLGTMETLLVLLLLPVSVWSGSGVAGEATYQEQWRPQLHFSQPENWMNDPNGLVYYQESRKCEKKIGKHNFVAIKKHYLVVS